MKLCRFELTESPGVARAGLFHEGKYYETDGERALGIHDLNKLRLLPPVGVPPTIRVFDSAESYRYVNTASLLGPLGNLDLPTGASFVTSKLRLAVIIKDRGTLITDEEASEFLLGFTTFIEFAAPGLDDLPSACGPFIQTTEESPTLFSVDADPLDWAISVNGVPHAAGTSPLPLDPRAAIVRCTRFNYVQAGDLIVLPPFDVGPERQLQPGDTLHCHIKALDPMNLHIL